MEKIQLKDYKIKKIRIFTKEQALADEIFTYFGKQLKFGQIMKFIKMKGHKAIYELWNEVRQSNPKNRLSLFIYKVKENKVIFNDNIRQVK